MKKRTYISWASLPPEAPTHMGIVWWLLLDRLGAPSWAYGVLGTVVAIVLIAFVIDSMRGESKDVPGFGH